MPVRVAAPTGIGGLVDTLLTPGLQHRRRAAPVGRHDAGRRASRCATSRPRRWVASAASATRCGASFRRRGSDTPRSSTGPDWVRPRGTWLDLTAPRVAAFLSDIEAEDGLLSMFVPARDGRARRGRGRRGLGRRPARRARPAAAARGRLYRHRHGSPGHGADHVLPLLAAAVADRAGDRRRAGARDVAVDLPARPERGQRGADGPAQLPRRVGRRRTP